MSGFTAAMQSALAADAPLVFLAVRMDLPTGVLRLVDGAGVVTFGGETYVGRSDTFGALADIQPPTDGVGDEVPEMEITVTPPDAATAIALNSAGVQGAEVQLWFGAVDRTSGAVVADPLLLFLGEVDVPAHRVGRGLLAAEFHCVSSMERFFDNEEGMRLSDSLHKLLFPGETGLSNVTGVQKKVYWGVEGSGGAIK